MKKDTYKTAAHLIYDCKYHVIFCPKYRRSILKDKEEFLKTIFQQVADEFNFQIIEMEIMPDHVHLLIDCNPRFGIMSCVSKLKSFSAYKLKEKYPSLKTRIPNIWTRSVFISSVGAISLETVKKYIEEQKNI